MTQSPYSHYSPYRTKSADLSLNSKLTILNNLTGNDAANYGIAGGVGGLGGAGIGALIQALRGKSIGKGALIGGGIGAGLGVGQKLVNSISNPELAYAFRHVRNNQQSYEEAAKALLDTAHSVITPVKDTLQKAVDIGKAIGLDKLPNLRHIGR
jgi:hypothetical protein